LGFALVPQAQRAHKLLAFGPGQQGPPSAPPPTTSPSEPITLRPIPPKLPGDFQGPPTDTKLPKRFDAVKTRKDAEQLATLASKVPVEVEQLSKGVLPKDLDQQLKEIQRLAKRIRSEVAQ
jgi:hypothetical protein